MNLICSGSELRSLTPSAENRKEVDVKLSSTLPSFFPFFCLSSSSSVEYSQRFVKTQHDLSQLLLSKLLWELLDPGYDGCGLSEVGDEGEGVADEGEGRGGGNALERARTEEVEDEEVESDASEEGVEESGWDDGEEDHFGRVWLEERGRKRTGGSKRASVDSALLFAGRKSAMRKLFVDHW